MMNIIYIIAIVLLAVFLFAAVVVVVILLSPLMKEMNPPMPKKECENTEITDNKTLPKGKVGLSH